MIDLIDRAQERQKLRIEQIEMNGGTQMRAALNETTIAGYIEDMTEYGGWGSFPPLDVFYDGDKYWLGDGFHRTNSYIRYVRDVDGILDLRQVAPVPVIVHSGTRRDAVLYAVGRNSDHGLRRNNEDKRRSVSLLLHDEEWRQWSNREIARRCNVGEALVRNMRAALTAHETQLDSSARKYVDRHGNTQTMQTAKIGRSVAYSPPPDPTPPPPVTIRRSPPPTTVPRGAVYISPAPALQPTADTVTVTQTRRELAAEITALVGRLEAALPDVAAAGQLIEDRALIERTDGYMRSIIGALKALKVRGL